MVRINIFQYQGQEEDHYTNILMSILELNNFSLTKNFIENLIPEEASQFEFNDLRISPRTKYCPQGNKEYEYIIGISPFQQALNKRNEYEDNSGSIPDAWICGENFNLLFEFKIRGVLDEAQIATHKRLLNDCEKVIRLEWSDVFEAINKIRTGTGSLERYLLDQFLMVTNNLKSKRRSSGMPHQIISHVNQENEFHFIITGSRNVRPYTVEQVYKGRKTIINDSLGGIQDARRWIAKYILKNRESLPIVYDGMNTVISDYYVVPGRFENKNQWNQWRIEPYLL